MNRRNFLKALGFATVATAVPFLSSVRPPDMTLLQASGLLKGDVFTIAGYYNPNGSGLQQFRVTSTPDENTATLTRA
jgi:hypothetical protein